jgi:hypothetical protein
MNTYNAKIAPLTALPSDLEYQKGWNELVKFFRESLDRSPETSKLLPPRKSIACQPKTTSVTM